MTLKGRFNVSLEQTATFKVLANPQQFAPALPRFHSMRMARNHSNKAIIKAKVGKDGMFGITTIELIRREPHAPAMVCYTGKGKIIGGVYHLSADFRLKERPSGGTHIYWKGAVAFKGRIFSTFGEAGLNGYVENEVYEAISNIRALLDDAWINPQGQI